MSKDLTKLEVYGEGKMLVPEGVYTEDELLTLVEVIRAVKNQHNKILTKDERIDDAIDKVSLLVKNQNDVMNERN